MPKVILERVQSILNKPIKEIETVATISHDDFFKNYLKKNTPLKMTKMMGNWKATELWSLDYFSKIGKDKETFMYKGNIRQNDTTGSLEHFKIILMRYVMQIIQKLKLILVICLSPKCFQNY